MPSDQSLLDRFAGPAPTRRLLVVAAIIIVLIALRLVAAALISIAPDEAYYLQWSRFPAASYYDHPPMVAWWVAASTAIFGETAFGVRFVSIVSLLPTSLAVYATGRLLFSTTVGERAALWTNATLLLTVGIVATPDAPSVMFWSFATLALAAALKLRQGIWWLAVGAFAGLGVLSKLTNLFLGIGIIALLVSTGAYRQRFRSPWLWAGGLVALVIITPMILWNLDHEWITFTKQMSRITQGRFSLLTAAEFIVAQGALLNPLMAIFVVIAAVAWIRRDLNQAPAGMGILLWTVAPFIAYMAIHSFRQSVQGHWLAPVFPILAIAAAAAAEQTTDWTRLKLRELVFPVGVALSLGGLIAAALPAGVIPIRLDVAQVIRGWERTADHLATIKTETGAAWIAVTSYSVGSALDYHLRRQGVPVILIDERRRYDFSPAPDPELIAAPALVATSTDAAQLEPCFAELELIATVDRRSGDARAESFQVFLARGARDGLITQGCDQLRRKQTE